ncbi:MAG: hypothetical protein AAB227_02215 [Pseudomonadota bacterium]
MLLAIAALFLSAGHAACACLGAAQNAAPVVQSSISDSSHAHHQGDEGVAATPDHSAPSPSNCGHCETIALAGDGSLATGSLPALQKSFAVAASPAIASTPQHYFGALARRIHWAAPPRRTPVSLKTRLRI